MRVCVFGAGAISGHLAARLAKGGAEVSIVARGQHLAAIQADGLRVRTPDEEIHVRVAATGDPATLGPQDAVLVTAKAPSLASVAAGIAPLLRPDTPVVFVLNGIPWWYFDFHGGALEGQALPALDPGGAVRAAVGPARAIGGVVYSACTVIAPGVVEVENRNGRLVLGEPDGSISARVEAIAAPLRAGGLEAEVTPRIRDWVWSKLLGNLGSGPMTVLTQAPLGDIYAEAPCGEATRTAYAEVAGVATALGCTVRVDADKQLAMLRRMNHRSSILQDLERGRPMEIDTIFDAPLQLARLTGVPTPTLDLLVALANILRPHGGVVWSEGVSKARALP